MDFKSEYQFILQQLVQRDQRGDFSVFNGQINSF